MSGSAWSLPILPIPGRRTATLRSVHRRVKRLVMLAWADFDSSPATRWVSDFSMAFGDDERPDRGVEERERIAAEGDDPDDYLPSERVSWSDVAEAGELTFWVHNLGHAATDLMEHWRNLALALEVVRLDLLLRELGYRRASGAFPSTRVAYYRLDSTSPFAADAYCRVDGTYHRICAEGGSVVPCMDSLGELLDEGAPVPIDDLPEEALDHARELLSRDGCGCAFCEEMNGYPLPTLSREASGWSGRFVDSMGSHGNLFLPLTERAHLAFINGKSKTWCLFYRTLDEGVTWECTFQPEWEAWRVRSAARTERCGRQAVLLELDRPDLRRVAWLCSTDLGATWTEVPLPPAGGALLRATLFENPLRPAELVVATADVEGTCRLHRSADGGETWLTSPALVHDGQPLSEVVGVSFSPFYADHLHAVARRATGRRVLVHSDDAGRTWTVREAPPGIDPHQIVAGSRGESLSIFGSTTEDAAPIHMRSGDGGRTWTTVVVRDDDGPLSMLAHPSGDWFWTTDAGRRVSTDEGASWAEIPAFGQDLIHVPGSRDVLYSQDEHALVRLTRITA